MKKQDEKAMEILLKYFYRKKYSTETIKRWASIAIGFLSFLETHDKSIDDIGDLLNSEGRVVQKEQFGVKEYIHTKTQYSAGYVNYLHQVLKRFYIAWEKHFPIDPDDFPDAKDEPVRKMFSREQILKIMDESRKIWIQRDKKYPGDLIGLRDYCCVLIGIECGPRRIQICSINVNDYDINKNTLFIKKAKKGRDTKRVLTETTSNALNYYMALRKNIDSKNEAMFLKKDGGRVTKSSLSEMLVITMKKAGVYEKGFGFHSFRRAKSLRLKNAGFTEEERNDILGWSIGSRMSHRYGMLDQSKVQKKATEAEDIFKREENIS